MRKWWVAMATAVLLTSVARAADLPDPASAPSAEALLAQVDRNLTYSTRTAAVKMTVENPRRTRVFEMRTFGRGADVASIEYLAPSRDKGTRMFRQGDELWMYLPAIERVQKISGHMLRQGVMGSDMSYEDLMGAASLRERYASSSVEASQTAERPAWKVTLSAKDKSTAYPKRVVWVDVELGIPLRQELYALSGMLLKTWEMAEPKGFGDGRWFPMRMVIVDHVRDGTKTTVELSELAFGAQVDDEVFSRRWLERR